MPITNACFISYPHPQVPGSYLASFVKDLGDELDKRLDGFVHGRVYLDEKRLLPGYDYNKALQQQICQSVCMVVVYAPEYARREYCRREFELMERIDSCRRGTLGAAAGPHQFIIPVSLGGEMKDLPKRLTADKRNAADFSAYRDLPPAAKRRINYSRTLRERVEAVAKMIRELDLLLNSQPGFGDPASCCSQVLAAPNSIAEWEAAPYPR